MIEHFHFLRPWWLIGLLPILIVAVLWSRHRGDASHWESQVAPELLAVLLEAGNAVRRRSKVWATAAALAIATLGLAGPAWERLPEPVTQKTDATIIVLDLSLSMYAEDVAPSRLIRARQKITDVLRLRSEGVTGLVTYAGDAHLVSPLTDDARTIANLLNALSPDMMPVLGSNVAAALEQARELFANSGFPQGRILLITDGVGRASEVAAYRDRDFPISILGVGTTEGGPIPLDFANQPGQSLTDQQGRTIIPQLDASGLAALAETTHGRYRTLSLHDGDILHLSATPLPGADASIEVEREFDTWADRGYWVCISLLPLALLGFRRGVLACFCLLLLPVPASADWWDDLWLRRDQQAHNALTEGDPQRAAELFTDPQWRASARYRNGDFAGAAAGFGGDPRIAGTYNLGNAFANQGEFERAIAAYAEVLAQDPSHEDAAFNKSLVEQMLEEQQSSEQNDQQQNDQSSDQQDHSQDGSGDPDQADQPPDQDQESGADQENEDTQDEQAPGEESGEEQSPEQLAQSRDEQSDALEQWLRRVPDDPGGLLRRKFRYETNQRLRRGDYQQQRPEQIW